jgi:hypothetical protein
MMVDGCRIAQETLHSGKAAGQVPFLRRFLRESVVDKNLRKFNGLPS